MKGLLPLKRGPCKKDNQDRLALDQAPLRECLRSLVIAPPRRKSEHRFLETFWKLASAGVMCGALHRLSIDVLSRRVIGTSTYGGFATVEKQKD